MKRLDAAGEIAPIARYGRCGEGPGEFRDITDVALDGDTVIVADYQRNVLTFFVASGDGHRTLRIERTADDPWNITDILSANEQEVLLNGSLSGTAPHDRGFIRRIDRASGAVLGQFVPEASTSTKSCRSAASWQSKSTRAVKPMEFGGCAAIAVWTGRTRR